MEKLSAEKFFNSIDRDGYYQVTFRFLKTVNRI